MKMVDHLLTIGRDNQNKDGRRTLAWVLPVAVLVVVMSTAFVERYLHEYEHSRLRSEILLLSIEEDAAEQAIAEYEAIGEGEVTPEIAEEVAENRREIDRALDELEGLNQGGEKLARVSEELSRYEAAVDEELALIEAGQLEQARTVDEERVDPGFETLHEAMEDATARLEAEAQRAAVLVKVATYGAALLAAIALIAVARLWQRDQALRSEQEALRKSEERFRSLAQNASDAVTVIDAKGAILYESPSVERIFGYKPEDRIGGDPFESVHPDDLGRARSIFAEVLNTPGVTPPVQARVRHRDGSWRHVEAISNNLLHNPDVGGIVITTRDITERERAEELIRRQAGLLEQTHDAVFMWKLGGGITYWNQGAQRLYGWSEEEALGRVSHELLKTSHPFPLQEFDRRLRRDGHWEGELVHHSRDGQRVLVESRHVLSRDGAEPGFVLETNKDITKRKRAEEALQESEEKYRTLVEAVQEGIGFVDSEERITYCNRAYAEIFELTPQELTGRSLFEFLDEEQRRKALEQTAMRENNVASSYELRITTGDGRKKDLSASGTPVMDANWGFQGAVHTIIDISERKRAEEELRRSEEKFRSFVETTEEWVWSIDLKGRHTYSNPAAERILGYRPQDLVGKSALPFIHEEDREVVGELLPEVIAEKRGWSGLVLRWRHKDGTYRYLESNAVPTFDSSGEVVGFQGADRDITERRRAEEELRRSEQRYRAVVENMSDIVTIFEADHTVRYVSPSLEWVLGYKPEDWIGTKGFDCLEPEEAERVMSSFVKVLEKPGVQPPIEILHRHADGSERCLEVIRNNLLHDPSVNAVVVNCRDITDRKRAEKEIKNSLSLLSATLESTADGILVTDENGTIRRYNGKFAKMWALPERAVASRDDYHALEFVADQLQNPEGFVAKIWELYARPEEESFDILRFEDGRVFERYSVPQRTLGEEGVVGRVWSFRDVTDRERVEQALRASEASLAEAQALARLGSWDTCPLEREAPWIEREMRWSDETYRILGFVPQEFVPTFESLMESIHPEDREHVGMALQSSILNSEPSLTLEHRILRPDGGVRFVQARLETTYDEGGEPVRKFGTLLDITERKRAEDALRESEERYRAVVERTTDGIFLADFSTLRILESNAALQGMLGYTAEELRGMSLDEVIAADRESIDRNVRRIQEEKSLLIGERRFRRKDGSLVDVDTSASVIPYGDGEVSCCISRDVTERKRAEEALREAEEKYRTLVEHLPAITYIEAPDEGEREWNLTYVSPQVEEILGYPVEEWLSGLDLWKDLIHPDDRERVLDEDARTDATGEPFAVEYRIFARDGRVVWIQDQAALVRDEKGRPRFWQGVMLDITERKRAEQALRENLDILRGVTEGSTDAIFVKDRRGRFLMVNSSCADLFGRPAHEMVGMHYSEIFAPDEARRIEEHDRRVMATGETETYEEVLRLGGRERAYLTTRGVHRDHRGNVAGVFGVARDITERKHAEERLRYRLEFEKLIAATSTNFVDLAPDDVDRGINRALRDIGEFVGVDRSYIFLLSPDGATLDNTHEWCAGEIEPQIENLKGLPVDAFGWAMGKIRRSEVVHVPRVAGLPPEASAEREEWQSEGIESLIMVPMAYRGSAVGFVGFDSVRGERAWSEDEILLLRTVGEMFVNALERKRVEEELRRSEARNRAILEAVPDLMFRVSNTGEFLDFQANEEDKLYVPKGEIIGSNVRDTLPPDVATEVLRHLGRALETGAVQVYEYRLRVPEGPRDFEVRFVATDVAEALCIIRDITERKLAEGELERSLERLAALNEASRILGSTLEMEEIGRRLLEITQRVTNLTAAAVYLRDEQGELRVGYTLGPEGLLHQAASTPAAQAARRGALEVRGHRPFGSSPRSNPDAAPLAGVCVPLRVRDRTVGILQAYGLEAPEDGAMVETLTGLANQAASALDNARLYAQLAERESQLKELVGKLILAQEEERRRVAREIHDGLTQMLVAAHQHLQSFADYHPPAAPEGQEDLAWVLEVVQQTVGEARRVIANLRPTALDDFGLATAIRLQAQALRDEGWDVAYEEALGEERLPVAMETALFRVAQEALTNTRRHARTTRVHIALERLEHAVRLRVRDWGRGFSPTAATDGDGPGERVGLSSMRERVALLGGNLEVSSQPGAGTSVVAEVPLLREGALWDGA